MSSEPSLHFIDVLKRCKQSSKEAVENLEIFSDFKKYMHVQRPVETELEAIINSANTAIKPSLILVCGGVGDGKSHILSYLKNKYSFLNDSNRFYLHNDATESFSPRKTSIETLANILRPFSDEGLKEENTQNIVLAINLGALNNFIDSDVGESYTRLRDYVQNKKILESVIEDVPSNDDDIFKYVNFSDYHMYELTEEGPESRYIKSILTNICKQTPDNPFYQAYLNDLQEDADLASRNPILQNYELLQHEDIQDKIIQLLIEAMVKEKLIISTRGLFDFIYNIIVPPAMENMNYDQINKYVSDLDFKNYMLSLLPFQLFERVDASPIQEALNRINPTRRRTEQLDQYLIEFKSRKDGAYLFAQYIDVDRTPYFSRSLVPNSPWRSDENTKEIQYLKQLTIKLFVYFYYLIPKQDHFSFRDCTYDQYMKYLYYWNKREWSKLSKLYREDVRESIYKWNGEGNGDLVYIQIGQPQTQYYALQKLDVEPFIIKMDRVEDDVLNKFLNVMTLQFRTKNSMFSEEKSVASIDIDYSLYALLIQIKNGYRPNKRDKYQYIKFVEFINRLSSAGNQKEEIVFENKESGKVARYQLKYDEMFDQYSFTEM